ncbi:uncharacterized protein LOC125177609 [Hyalella azteca]|uniref:Uncharacterized protein LOC125177609 n=1 Tax=Hyalella azteca TaxID=294128 RepID=A0A979FH47_HYAAZ|nr:uncharacterized protein LOC125177609 [Hyalella azteca]
MRLQDIPVSQIPQYSSSTISFKTAAENTQNFEDASRNLHHELKPMALSGPTSDGGSSALFFALPMALASTTLLLTVMACFYRRKKISLHSQNHGSVLFKYNDQVYDHTEYHAQSHQMRGTETFRKHDVLAHVQKSLKISQPQRQETSYILKPPQVAKQHYIKVSNHQSDGTYPSMLGAQSSAWCYEMIDNNSDGSLGENRRSFKKFHNEKLKASKKDHLLNCEDFVHEDPEDDMAPCGSACEAFCLPDLSYQKHRELWFSRHSKLLLHAPHHTTTSSLASKYPLHSSSPPHKNFSGFHENDDADHKSVNFLEKEEFAESETTQNKSHLSNPLGRDDLIENEDSNNTRQSMSFLNSEDAPIISDLNKNLHEESVGKNNAGDSSYDDFIYHCLDDVEVIHQNTQPVNSDAADSRIQNVVFAKRVDIQNFLKTAPALTE